MIALLLLLQDLGTPPLEAAKKMTVPPGFKVSLFAGEPDIRQPNAFCVDDRGRLWVAENYSYTGPGGPWKPSGRDRVLIFEDVDNDGKFDSRKVFHDKLSFISGLEVGFGGVWVGSPPNLLFIPDKDGDDVPDGQPVALLDGWGNHDQHETLNSFIWGPDGWLYGWQGVFVHSNVGAPGSSERKALNAAMWRYHPTKKTFEVFAEGTSNPWGVDYDDHGAWFAEACVIPHLWHVIQGGRYQRQSGKHFNPHTYDDLKTIADHKHDGIQGRKGGHAHGGARFVLHDLWPGFRGKYLVGTIHHHGIYTEAFERKGSGYVGKHVDDFLMSNDLLYLGFNHEFGPDGSLFVIDWYDPKTCHGQTPEHQATGRIYRISYGDPKKAEVDLRKLPSAELVKLQLDRNDWFVRHARRILQERGPDPAVHAALLDILKTNPDVTRKLRALWALYVTEGTFDVLSHENEHLRAWGVHLGGTLKDDPSPVVRLAIASALQRMPLEERWDVAAALLAHAEDAEDHNLPLMIWYGVEPLVTLDTPRALKLAAGAKIPRVRQYITRRVAAGMPVKARAVGADGLALHLKPESFDGAWRESTSDPRTFDGKAAAGEKDGRKAVVFSGGTLSARGDPSLVFTDKAAFTLSAWVWLEGPSKGRWRGLVTKSREEGPWYGLWIEPAGRWFFGGQNAGVAGPAAEKGWHHVAAVQDANGRKLYLDGKAVADGPRARADGPGAFTLGGAGGVDEPFQGALGEIRLYRRALDPAEIEKLAAP